MRSCAECRCARGSALPLKSAATSAAAASPLSSASTNLRYLRVLSHRQVQLWRGVGGAAHCVCEEGLGQLYEPYLERGGDDVAVCAQRLRRGEGKGVTIGETGYNCRRSDGRQR